MTQQEILHHQKRSQRSAEQILDAAVDVISTQGLAAFTMSTVATMAGGSVGKVYARYANRDALLLAVKDREFSRLESLLQQRLAESDSAAEVITQFVSVISSSLFTAPKLFSFMVSHSADDVELHGRGFGFHRRSRSLLFDRLKKFGIDDEAAIGQVYEMIVQSLLMRVISVGAINGGEPYPGFPTVDDYRDFLIDVALSRLPH